LNSRLAAARDIIIIPWSLLFWKPIDGLLLKAPGDKRSVPELKPPPGGEKERTAKTGSGFQPRSGLFLFYKNRKKGAWKE